MRNEATGDERRQAAAGAGLWPCLPLPVWSLVVSLQGGQSVWRCVVVVMPIGNDTQATQPGAIAVIYCSFLTNNMSYRSSG
jgi:hypothetical protein